MGTRSPKASMLRTESRPLGRTVGAHDPPLVAGGRYGP